MSDIKNGGPAFPDPGRAQSAKQREKLTNTGITVRDHFAGQALQGIIAGAMADGSALGKDIPEIFADAAYKMADAMLRARGET